MNCKNNKTRIKKGIHYHYCIYFKKVITFDNCNGCPQKEYKQFESIRKRSKVQNKKEKSRYSVFASNKAKCLKCGIKTSQITMHELFPGRNRTNSIKFGFVIPLCIKCHSDITNNYEFIDNWKVKAQKYFEKNIGSKEDFIAIFGKNYIYIYKKRARNKSLL